MRFLLLLCLLLPIQSRAEANPCQVKQTSQGDYGVAEWRWNGWVYLVRSFSTYEEALRALELFQGSGRCQ